VCSSDLEVRQPVLRLAEPLTDIALLLADRLDLRSGLLHPLYTLPQLAAHLVGPRPEQLTLLLQRGELCGELCLPLGDLGGELLRLPLPPQGARALSIELGDLAGKLPCARRRALRRGALGGHGAPQRLVSLGTLLELVTQRLEDGGVPVDLLTCPLRLAGERSLASREVAPLPDQLLDTQLRVCASLVGDQQLP